MDSEKSQTSQPVLLCWTDHESGEELRIFVHGPPEFLEELREEGFRPDFAPSSGAVGPHAPCVVFAST